MASLGGRRLHAQHVAAAYQRTNMKLQRGSYGTWKAGVGCGCGVIAVAATEARHVKNEAVDGNFIFFDTEAVVAEMKKEHGKSYIESFMRGFDGNDVRSGLEEVDDEEGLIDGAAAYDACIRAGIPEIGTTKESPTSAYTAS